MEIKQQSWNKEQFNSRLEFNIKGKDINNVIINTIKRVATTYIPIYAFTNINITENTSIFNNNYLKLRIQNLVVVGITSDIDIYKQIEPVINEDEEETNIMMDDINLEVDKTANTTNLKQLTMYVDYTNNTKEIITVGTDDCKFYVMENKINSPYSVNIPIIKLQPGQHIKLSAITTLGIEKQSAIFSPVCILTYRENTDNDYDMIIESRGQIDEKKILNTSILNIIDHLDNFYKLLPDEKDMEGKIKLENGDHTMGNLISYGLQKHKDIEFAGYNMPHPLGNFIYIHYKLSKNNIKNVCKDVIEDYKKIFNTINENINKNIK
jgi:DNA-directed RNA polymerase subunit L